MPDLPRPKCKVPTCLERAEKKSSLCLEHQREHYKDVNKGHDYDPFYQSALWRKVRLRQLAEFPMCALCLQRNRVSPASVVDHIIPRKLGGKNFEKGNLQSLCKPCHDQKRGRERWGK